MIIAGHLLLAAAFAWGAWRLYQLGNLLSEELSLLRLSRATQEKCPLAGHINARNII